VWVANSPDYGVGEVATHALALALALIRNIVAYHRDIEAGQWHYLSSGPLRRAGDMTLGIVGLGRIGKRMAHVSRNVFKRVVACDPYLIDGDFPAFCRASPPRAAVRGSERRIAARAPQCRDARP
jgi:D-3-phosphoglycerate dehydrogenase